MKITYHAGFISAFTKILDYIALDSKNSAIKFKVDVKAKIEDLPYMPFKYKKSFYFEDDNIRELTFKGYVVVYEINLKEDNITVIGIKKYKEKF
jgi:mRNA-degrading endonuclease RelE of RelBE toxin-antitoxin system